ncbi:hypothetical protein [Leeuwenhoekiella palythoae]|uniref:Uncharacterized protein n=1 Tax=Leeuwenhoekiella palythoae TaxID=573501 RepID=A0A1M5UC27_9FLAO|nr:hypothetical protein [Leeuwenhoekiella palythoae]RXG27167.1 hypothetical protein DSM01_3241 [Leeuwenhoekiella palythoae]SHH60471.1 hypothetical protein SAMN04487999_0620 [Leeuwenhoekiella palythoae]
MAKQAGIIKLKGTIGDIAFYKSGDGHMARFKGGIDKKRIATDPAFQRTRENGAEFGRAGKGGKLLRSSMQLLLQQAKDAKVVSRLTTVLLAIIKTDTLSARGARNLTQGDLGLLNGFDFNANSPLSTTLSAPYSVGYDRATGVVGLELEAYTPHVQIAAPAGATHYKLSCGASELDFEEQTSLFKSVTTGILPYQNTEVAATTLEVSLTAGSTLQVVHALSIEFYQEVNGTMYSLQNGAFNAMAVVQVAQPA